MQARSHDNPDRISLRCSQEGALQARQKFSGIVIGKLKIFEEQDHWLAQAFGFEQSDQGQERIVIASFRIQLFEKRIRPVDIHQRAQQGTSPVEFARQLQLLILDQPTRGLDVGSIEFIHRQVIEKRTSGTAVLLVSAELDEVLELSDRIAVMFRGAIVAIVDGRTADKNEVGLLMATGGRETVAVGQVPAA